MSHEPWSEWIGDLVSDELPNDRRERHLSSCEACRAERDALRALRGATRSLAERSELPAELEGAIRSSLDSAEHERPAPSSRGVRLPAWLAAAAVLAIVIAGAWWLQEPPPRACDLPGAAVASYRLHRAGQLFVALF